MKKWIAIALGAALLLGASALLWPRAVPPEAAPETPAASLPDFAPILVSAEKDSGLSLTGTIFDPTGRPVAGAEVFLAASAQASLVSVRCAECGELLLSCPARETSLGVADLLRLGKGTLTAGASTRSDAKGAFRFEHLAGVSFTLWARAAGLGESVRERAAPGEPVELFLPPLRSIAGSVQDDQGRAMAGATVYAVSRRLALPHQATSAQNGTFEVEGLGEGPFYLLAEAEGFLPAVAAQVEAGPQPVRLTLQSPRRLEVTVRSGGKPAEANVRLAADHLTLEQVAKGGLASFARLFPDHGVVTAVFGGQSSAPHAVVLTEPVTRLTLDLEPGGTLTVTVTDDAAGPVPGAEVVLSTRGGEIVSKKKTRAGELAVFGPLGGGEYFLRGSAEGYKTAELPVLVRAGDTNVELVLGKGTVISGRVLDEYGRPAPGISILVTPTGDSVVADGEGRFVAQVPTPGLYSLHAHHSDWGGGKVSVTAPASGVELQLEPRAGVQVTVQSQGRRVEGANVVLWLDREGSFRSDRPSGADG
ncbi:MAG: carboxypeptidase-like regulatory domain-containing protein, partial [Myxococcaceae bacterium]